MAVKVPREIDLFLGHWCSVIYTPLPLHYVTVLFLPAHNYIYSIMCDKNFHYISSCVDYKLCDSHRIVSVGIIPDCLSWFTKNLEIYNIIYMVKMTERHKTAN